MKVDLFSFKQGSQRRISFMSQTVGLMADLDIETEHLRWMGDVRFIWGYLRGGRKSCTLLAKCIMTMFFSVQLRCARFARWSFR